MYEVLKVSPQVLLSMLYLPTGLDATEIVLLEGAGQGGGGEGCIRDIVHTGCFMPLVVVIVRPGNCCTVTGELIPIIQMRKTRG